MKGKSDREIEERFLEALEEDPPPVEEMLESIRALGARGETEKAAGWAELLQDLVIERGDTGHGVCVLALRCELEPDDAAFGESFRSAVSAMFRGRRATRYLEGSGFETGIPPAEAVRRLGVLTSLEPGVLCMDGTWGFGVVKRVDDFYGRVEIDFRKKPGHRMSFGYAAKTLVLTDETHLYTRLHREPDTIAEMVARQPEDVVRMALESFGEMTPEQLRDRLVDDVVEASDWKRFWEAARKQLRAEGRIEVPARRDEVLRIARSEERRREDMVRNLSRERDPARVVKIVAALEKASGGGPLEGAALSVAAERLAFAVHACAGENPSIMALAVMALDRLAERPDASVTEDSVDSLLKAETLAAAMGGMPGRQVRMLLDFLWQKDSERTTRGVSEVITAVEYGVLNEVVEFLDQNGLRTAWRERMKEAANEHEIGIHLVYWLCLEWGSERVKGLVDPWRLASDAMAWLGRQVAGSELRAQNQLRVLFSDMDWLGKALNELDGPQRQILLVRLQKARGWDIGEKRSLMARMVKLFPDLEEVLRSAAASGASKDGGSEKVRLTSWRSYKERQGQLKELVEKTLPENSREIAVARSYGDLRENFEYQAARDRQRLLLQRKQELQADLGEVRGTDFAGVTADRAGPGTVVAVRLPAGRQQRFVILGEWDSDEQLGIISSTSRLARRLSGAVAGDVCDTGDDKLEVLSVEKLTRDVVEWVRGTDVQR